jgi:hypothetical protein
VLSAGPGDPPGPDLPLIGDIFAQQVKILVIDVTYFFLTEITELALLLT